MDCHGLWRAVWLPITLALLASFVGYIFLIVGHPFWGALFLFASIIFWFDANGRKRDFDHLVRISPKIRKYLYGRYASTACGRQAMIAVEPKAYWAYYDAGYRWYHIFPDHTFSRNSPFLKQSFWNQLFSGQRSMK